MPIYFLTMDGLLKLAFRLAFITVLQFLEELPDRQAADAVRGRIDWKYLLGLALDDPGFDFTVRISIFGHAWCEGKQSRSCWTLCSHVMRNEISTSRRRSRKRISTETTSFCAILREG